MWCQSWKRCYQWCQDASLRVLQQFSNATPNISGAHVQSWKHVWCSHLSVFAVVAMLCFILCEKRSVGSSRHFPRPPEISQHLWWTLLNYNGAHKTPRPLCECLCKICAISITALVNFELFTARFCSHLHPAPHQHSLSCSVSNNSSILGVPAFHTTGQQNTCGHLVESLEICKQQSLYSLDMMLPG